DANFRHAGALIFANVDAQPPAGRHRLPGINHQIDQNLFDLAGDDGNDRLGVIAAIDLDAVLAEVLFGQKKHFFDELDEIDFFAAIGRVPREAEHAADDRRGALTPFEDLFEGLLLSRIGGA